MVAKRSESTIGQFRRPGRATRADAMRVTLGRSRRCAAVPMDKDLSIRVEPGDGPDGASLIEASQKALLARLPASEIFTLERKELTAPNVTFFVARIDGLPVGCAALQDVTSFGEVKRLFVHQDARGKGVARALMAEVERYCRDIGLTVIKLETSPHLTEAAQLYQALGYTPCAAFGSYPVLDSSLFLEKTLGRL